MRLLRLKDPGDRLETINTVDARPDVRSCSCDILYETGEEGGAVEHINVLDGVV